MHILRHRFKRFIRVLMGKDFYPPIKHRCRTQRFGSQYGGWDVAIDDLTANSVVYSFGVGEDISFDLALIDGIGATVHAFDPTPRSVAWVRAQNLPDRFIMHDFGLADHDGHITFNPPENESHVSYTLLDRPATSDKSIVVPVKCLATILKELGHERIDLLKMDIEGAEYQVVDYLIDTEIRPTQLLMEFHHRFPNVGLDKTKDAVQKLRGIGYELFSVSATGEEYCFIRKPV